MIIFILGFAGNGLVIWIAGFKVKKSVVSTWYLSLAVADFIFCSTLPFVVVYTISKDWTFGGFMCKFNSFMMSLNMYSSIFLLVIISVDRCVLVMFPVWAQNKRTIRKASVTVILAWIIAATFSAPSAAFRDIRYDNNSQKTIWRRALTCIVIEDKTKMAAREQREAQRLSRICYLTVYLLLTGLFIPNCSALLFYSRQELLDIRTQTSDSFIADLRLIPEISRTPEAAHSSWPGGSARRWRREHKERRGRRGGLRAKLKIIPHRLPLPSIFLANVRSLANKMDEIRLSITNDRRIMDSNVMIFTVMIFTRNMAKQRLPGQRY
ncbi:hypothetical protein SRHO_G00260050 [Serrasalmus rhombeus]